MQLLQAQQVYIRLNQVGFLPGDLKTAVIMSGQKLTGKKYHVFETKDNMQVFSGQINGSLKAETNFKYNYRIDFSELKNGGRYYLEVEGSKSLSFLIGTNIYNRVVDSLMLFFKVQRCGYTNPLLHPVCHPNDATGITADGKFEAGPTDLTGGWHDAGDYIKFLNTAVYATYTMLFAYDFDPVKFGYDNDNNGTPDILEEAKTGLDWLIRLNYANNKLVTQVQDMRDHNQGWRKPELDKLSSDRPAYSGMGKNIIGIYSATLALAGKIWKEKLHYNDFANKCLSRAKSFYAVRNNVPDIDKSQSGMYQDSRYFGKLALGAIELYNVTNQKEYLSDAIELADKAKSDFWWSWGDINSYVHYRLAKVEPRFQNYIYENLKVFNKSKNKLIFGEVAEDSWGLTNALLGASLQAILYKKLTGDPLFDSLAVFQRDYVLGKNQWGVSFIYNIGTVFSRNFHSQLAYFNGGYLPGAVAAGPVSRKKLESYKIKTEGTDRFMQFQTEKAVYQDDRNDFITNEPTISANATAVFVMGYFSDRN